MVSQWLGDRLCFIIRILYWFYDFYAVFTQIPRFEKNALRTTDGPTDRPSYRVTCAWLKIESNFPFQVMKWFEHTLRTCRAKLSRLRGIKIMKRSQKQNCLKTQSKDEEKNICKWRFAFFRGPWMWLSSSAYAVCIVGWNRYIFLF